jgi:flagellar hook-associated protein 1 FlgK
MGFGGLSTAVSGLYANQRALDVIAHNIANADNTDYVRQSVIQENSWYDAVGSNASGTLAIGTGVDVDSVRQIRDTFLDNKYRKESVKYGYYSTMQQTYETMESTFNEVSNNGLQKSEDLFWEKWNAVAGDSQSLTTRSLLKESAIAYCESANHLGSTLDQYRSDTDKSIQSKVKDINEAAKTVADMNDKILKNELQGDNANDYRDTRNKAIDELSEDLGVQITYSDNGSVNVLVNGNPIVSGKNYDKINMESYPMTGNSATDAKNYGMTRLVWNSTKSDFNPDKECGSLRALMDTRDKVIVDYKDRVDSMVKKMANDINNVHRTGYGIDAPTPPATESSTGLNFFVGADGVSEDNIDADTIKLNPELANLNKIAASKTPQTYKTDSDGKMVLDKSNMGDATCASDIMNLRTKSVYIFKEIVSSPITSTTIPTTNNTFNVIFDKKNYTVTMPSGTTYANAADLAAGITNALKNAKDGSGNTVDLTQFIDVQAQAVTQAINIKVNSKYTDTNSIFINDTSKVFEGMGFPENTKYDDYYSKIIGGIGQGGNDAKTIASGQASLITQIDGKRKSISAVSKDQEMTEMLKYQKAYNASARVVNAMDEMLDVIVNKLKS